MRIDSGVSLAIGQPVDRFIPEPFREAALLRRCARIYIDRNVVSRIEHGYDDG